MTRKTVHFRKQSQTEFAKAFTPLCETKSAWEVWSDFVTMAALSIVHGLDREGPPHDEQEAEYLRIINRYPKKHQQIFPELLVKMVLALEEDPEQDFLGEMFMALELGNHWKGQFFTPYSVCELMSEMTIKDRALEIEKRGWVTIHDPCCGAGALLIAARNAMARKGIGPKQTLYVAQDIDQVAALMCYLQLSLLGCAGYVVVGNSLAHPTASPTGLPLLIAPSEHQEVWMTLAFYDEVWVYRIMCEKLKWLTTPKEVHQNA